MMANGRLTEQISGTQQVLSGDTPERIIRDVAEKMGIANLKPKQFQAISAFLSGRDVIAYRIRQIHNICSFVCNI